MPIRTRLRSNVAVLEVHGVIGNHIKIPEYSRLIHSIATDTRLKALLLDIDSPGGSATGSEVLYREIQRVSEIKPVHAYVRGMAASGGYYLACAASRVYALPTALVGSIGVIYLRPVLEQLLAKIGVEFSVYKSGEFKDMTGFWRAPSDRESEKFQELINEIFDNFVTVVANGRSLEESKVREVATGEVLTAQRGINVGLVDEIGDFKDALEALALLGNCKPSPKWVRPSRSFSQRLLGRTSISGRAVRLGLLDGLQRIMAGGFYYLEPGHISGGDYSLE
ncbi:MAG: signal peptide peptidase SppA [Chloroflexota bacterium]|nr:signal peptide peptidase SppA [Chloroflexota bacterium]